MNLSAAFMFTMILKPVCGVYMGDGDIFKKSQSGTFMSGRVMNPSVAFMSEMVTIFIKQSCSHQVEPVKDLYVREGNEPVCGVYVGDSAGVHNIIF
jgi:hypothetical protein